MLPAVVPLPPLTSQSFSVTVAQSPRIEVPVLAVVVVIPFVVPWVPVGSVKLIVLPALRVIAPRVSKSGLAVALALRVIAEAPELSVRPLTRSLLVVDALPVMESVPPPRVRLELFVVVLIMFVFGALATE